MSVPLPRGEAWNFHHLRFERGVWELYDTRRPAAAGPTFSTFADAEKAWDAQFRAAVVARKAGA